MATLSSTKHSITATLFFLLLFILPTRLLPAQQSLQDVVYLKNGSIIRGVIIEQVPNQSIKIQTRDGNLFVYKIEEIQKISKEPMIGSSRPKRDNNAPLGNFGILINPLGFVQFGPVAQVEIKVAPNMVIGPHFRWAGLGLLTHAVMDYDQFDAANTAAVGIHFKQFLGTPNALHRYYVGCFAEYGWVDAARDYDMYYWVPSSVGGGYYSSAGYNYSYISLIGNIGRRWRFSPFFINLGLIAGLALEINDEMYEPESIKYSNDLFFVGMLELSFGFEL